MGTRAVAREMLLGPAEGVMSISLRDLGVGLLMLAGPVAAAAQPVASFASLAERVQPGATVVVRTTDGKSLRARLEGVSATTIDVRTRGVVRQVPAAGVSAVTTRVRDSVANGFYIGAAIGAIGGVLSAANFSGEFRSEDMLAGGVPFALFGAGLYGCVGAFIDSRIKRTETLYAAAPPQVRVMPAVTARRAGLTAIVRW
jgi:hypothetical protein